MQTSSRFVIDPYNLRRDAFDFESELPASAQADSKPTDPTLMQWESAENTITRLECRNENSIFRYSFPKTNSRNGLRQRGSMEKETREFDQWSLTPSTAANSRYIGESSGEFRIYSLRHVCPSPLMHQDILSVH